MMRYIGTLFPLMAVCQAMPLMASFSQAAIDDGNVLADLNKQAYDVAMKRIASGKVEGCSPENTMVRREWRHMPPQDRMDFIAAVECIQQQPSIYGNIDAAKSVFDDFVVLHWNLTHFVHMSATFLTFHRLYLWEYENKLRTLCGYKGTLPYWEWGFDIEDPRKSPLFDGSPTSMGSDGAPEPHLGIVMPGGSFTLPPGTGGGCVQKGPFSNMTVHLGPFNLPTYGADGVIRVPDLLKDNPRCLKRDLSGYPGAKWASLRNSTRLILESPNIEVFQGAAQGMPDYTPYDPGMGVHGGGHYMISGDPGGDVYLSPGEPVFYLHHAQLDRLYFIWQNLDWDNRQNIFGTGTMNNDPPSPDVKLTDILDIRPLHEPTQVYKLLDTAGGTPFCYVYSAE